MKGAGFMEKVAVFLAEGFEEIEGLMVVDLLRRAGNGLTSDYGNGRYYNRTD